MSISSNSDTSWVGKKPIRRLGGMADALSIATDLGFSVPPPTLNNQEETQSMSSMSNSDKSDDLIKVLRELTSVQRNIANLKVEVQGRKDDKNVAHLTHVSEMEKKCESLARITAILKDVIQNKVIMLVFHFPRESGNGSHRLHRHYSINLQDRIIARLQQPYSLDCIPVEAEYQKQFSELLLKAASDYGALTASVEDFQWSQNFRESPTVWGEMLRPIPVALASCTRFFEAMSAMRESLATLQHLRVGPSSLPMTPAKDNSQGVGEPECVTPLPPWQEEASSDDLVRSNRRQGVENQREDEDGKSEVGDPNRVDSMSQRRLSWPPSVKKSI